MAKIIIMHGTYRPPVAGLHSRNDPEVPVIHVIHAAANPASQVFANVRQSYRLVDLGEDIGVEPVIIV
ncbi:MAG: hypothetical protein ACP5NY_09170 [Thermocladium sp.]